MFRSKIKILILQFLSFFIFIGLSIGCENNDPIEPEINDPIVEVPDLTDNEILDFVQKETLKYFWEFAESNSGAARERYHPDKPFLNEHVVTTGGTGFVLALEPYTWLFNKFRTVSGWVQRDAYYLGHDRRFP